MEEKAIKTGIATEDSTSVSNAVTELLLPDGCLTQLADDIAHDGDSNLDPTVQTVVVSQVELPDVLQQDLPEPQMLEQPSDAKVIPSDECSNGEKIATEMQPQKMEKKAHHGISPCPPTKKKLKIVKSASKQTKRGENKENDECKDLEKDKDGRRQTDLDKFWSHVKKDPKDFMGWTRLLQCVDAQSDVKEARKAFDAFLGIYPYCYGYWRKYAEYEKRKGNMAKCIAVYERSVKAIPISVDMWIHYIAHMESNTKADEETIRGLFKRAIDACGLEFRSDKLWNDYIRWETENQRLKRVVSIYDRLLTIPTQGLKRHFRSFHQLIMEHPITITLEEKELKQVRNFLYKKSLCEASSHSSLDKSTTLQKSRAGDKRRQQYPDHPSTLSAEEIAAIQNKVIAKRRRLCKATEVAVDLRQPYEERIKRPYFHVKTMEDNQLQNWRNYLDFEMEQGDQVRVIFLFERCLVACASYDEFWLKLIHYLESLDDRPAILAIMSDVFRRGCQIHVPGSNHLHAMWADFEDRQNNFATANKILLDLEKKCQLPSEIMKLALRRINIERRGGELANCRQLYEHYISTATNKTIGGFFGIKYARFLHKTCNDLDGGMLVLRQAQLKYPESTRIALEMIDLAMQRANVDEDEVVRIIDEFMAREEVDSKQKVKFAKRKVEFLDDFGSSVQGVLDAQRALDRLAMEDTKNRGDEIRTVLGSAHWSYNDKFYNYETDDMGAVGQSYNSAPILFNDWSGYKDWNAYGWIDGTHVHDL